MDAKGEREAGRGFFERLEQGYLFVASTATLRLVAFVAGASAVLAAAAFLWFAVPPSRTGVPPEVPLPQLPPKATVGAVRAIAEEPREAEPAAAPQASEPAERTREAPPAPARTRLDEKLDEYRPIAAAIGIPVESESRRACVSAYWGNCLEWGWKVTRRGIGDLLKRDVLPDGTPEEVQIAVLDRARTLFETIEGRGLATLSGAEGAKTFQASYVQVAQEILQAFRRIEKGTDDSMPEFARIRLPEDLYPAVTGAVAGETVEARRASVTRTLAALVHEEARRSREAAAVLRAYRKAVRERDRAVAALETEHSARVVKAAAVRMQALWAGLASIGIVTSIGILLALLAIERHLRWLRGERFLRWRRDGFDGTGGETAVETVLPRPS